jgi:hypothetical protein
MQPCRTSRRLPGVETAGLLLHLVLLLLLLLLLTLLVAAGAQVLAPLLLPLLPSSPWDIYVMFTNNKLLPLERGERGKTLGTGLQLAGARSGSLYHHCRPHVADHHPRGRP